jgi:hypothetical protein
VLLVLFPQRSSGKQLTKSLEQIPFFNKCQLFALVPPAFIMLLDFWEEITVEVVSDNNRLSVSHVAWEKNNDILRCLHVRLLTLPGCSRSCCMPFPSWWQKTVGTFFIIKTQFQALQGLQGLLA